jgi:hypothetical protein
MAGSREDPSLNSSSDQFEWPRNWEGEQLRPVSIEPQVQKILRGFPGQVAQFAVGTTNRKVLLRRCREATRDLHPAEDCYRVLGWRCEPIPAIRDAEGNTWSRFRVVRPDGTEIAVRQCYFAILPDESPESLEALIIGARSWPDVSSWYWNAGLPGSGVQMTLAVTVTE